MGDACDLDTDGDALADTVDGCPGTAAATTSGCPSVGRKAALHFRKKKRRLTFVVRSDAPGCRAGAEASLWRVKRGKDTRLLVAETDASGRYRAKAPRRAGRYYLRIASSYAAGQAECGAARSNTERVR
ncbi:thrombospondin type 3 repeat-containing protein [Nocardioides cavernae]|nr:thrombospondin type 3 repeat-containing protein [Nocardioides cavernae]